jgi:hypothetical protein
MRHVQPLTLLLLPISCRCAVALIFRYCSSQHIEKSALLCFYGRAKKEPKIGKVTIAGVVQW